MSCGDKDFRVEAANAYFGRRQKTCIDLETATPAGLDGTYFLLSDLNTDYYVWFDLDAGSTDPAVAGRTGVEVSITTGDNVATMAAALKAALDALTDKFYSAVELGGCVCIEVFALGLAKNDSLDGDTGLPVTQTTIGSYSFLGCLAEDFEFAPETSEVDITCHQEGETPLDKIVTGMTMEIELGLLDTSKERLKELIGQGIGQTYTPSGGSELIGLGSNSLGKSAFDIGGELQIIPVKDATRAWTFPIAVPKVSSLSYSAVEKQVLNVAFSVLLDRKAKGAVNFAYFGVTGQNVR